MNKYTTGSTFLAKPLDFWCTTVKKMNPTFNQKRISVSAQLLFTEYTGTHLHTVHSYAPLLIRDAHGPFSLLSKPVTWVAETEQKSKMNIFRENPMKTKEQEHDFDSG